MAKQTLIMLAVLLAVLVEAAHVPRDNNTNSLKKNTQNSQARLVSSSVFNHMGYAVNVVGDVAYHIRIPLKPLQWALVDLENVSDKLPKQSLARVQKKFKSLQRIVTDARAAVSESGHATVDALPTRHRRASVNDTYLVKREKRFVQAIPILIGVAGALGVWNVANSAAATRNWITVDNQGNELLKLNDDLLVVQENMDKATAMVNLATTERRLAGMHSAVTAALDGQLHSELLDEDEADTILASGRRSAEARGLRLLPQTPLEIVSCPAALLVSGDDLVVAVRLPFVVEQDASFRLYFVQSGMLDFPDGRVVEFNAAEWNYFAINEATGRHAIFSENEMKDCRRQGNVMQFGTFNCYSLQLIYASSHKSCHMALYKGEEDAIEDLCSSSVGADLDITRVGPNSLKFQAGGVVPKKCIDPTSGQTNEGITHYHAYQPVYIDPYCRLEGYDFTFRASFLANDNLELNAADYMNVSELYIRNKEVIRRNHEELKSSNKNLGRAVDLVARGVGSLLGLRQDRAETTKEIVLDIVVLLGAVVLLVGGCYFRRLRQQFMEQAEEIELLERNGRRRRSRRLSQ